jgi:transposase InsO family protein
MAMAAMTIPPEVAEACVYFAGMDEQEKQTLALWRLGVLGPLVSSRLGHGDRLQYFEQAAGRLHQRPDGRFVKLSVRTIEGWYYAWRQGGFEALYPKGRSDSGLCRAIAPDLAELILKIKREKPRRSIRRIIRMLERARLVQPDTLSRSSVHRLLKNSGISARPVRGPAAERRSFLPEHPSDLWLGDVMHGPTVVAPDARLCKSYLITQLDGATRYAPHSFFALSETAADHEYGFKQAILKHGPPRSYYVDLGAAYISDSLRIICAELGIHLIHTQPRDCEAKGAIERFHRTWREEVGDELPNTALSIEELNAKHWAWLSAEYHARKHETTGRAPREHWLEELEYLREVPAHKNIDELFLHREKRLVRKDATVRFGGKLLEVRAQLVGQQVELRFDPKQPDALPRVFVDGRFYCDTVPLDRYRNASRKRLRPKAQPEPDAVATTLDPLQLIQDEHYRRVRPVGAALKRPKPADTYKE